MPKMFRLLPPALLVILMATISGIIFGAILGSANAYLGLKVGLTIGTSIPESAINCFVSINCRIAAIVFSRRSVWSTMPTR